MKPEYSGFGAERVSWCKNHQSAGEFFMRADNLCWYFEKEEDALLFILVWS